MKLYHIGCLFLIANFTKSGATQCSRGDLAASDLINIDVGGKPSLRKHEFTSRSLSEFWRNIPPPVFEDVKVRNNIPYLYLFRSHKRQE